jgi:MFS family permease
MEVTLPNLSEAAQEFSGWTAALAAEVARAPWPVAAALLALGLVQLALGGRPRRPVAVIGGAAIAALGGSLFQAPLGQLTGLSAQAIRGVAAAAGGSVCGAFPILFPIAAGSLPGALAAAALAPEAQRPFALALGAAAGAAGGWVLARWVAAAVAASSGAWAVSLGLAGALQHLGAGLKVAAHPAFLLATTAVLGVAGFAYQLPTAWRRQTPNRKGGTQGLDAPSRDGPHPQD